MYFFISLGGMGDPKVFCVRQTQRFQVEKNCRLLFVRKANARRTAIGVPKNARRTKSYLFHRHSRNICHNRWRKIYRGQWTDQESSFRQRSKYHESQGMENILPIKQFFGI